DQVKRLAGYRAGRVRHGDPGTDLDRAPGGDQAWVPGQVQLDARPPQLVDRAEVQPPAGVRGQLRVGLQVDLDAVDVGAGLRDRGVVGDDLAAAAGPAELDPVPESLVVVDRLRRRSDLTRGEVERHR